jgi:hypothetical protein
MAEESSAAVMDAPSGDVAEGSTPTLLETPVVQAPPVVERTGPEVLNQPPATPSPLLTPTTEPTPARVTPQSQPDESLLNWRNLVDAEYRNDPTLAKYTSVGEALKAHVHQQRLLGNSIQIPHPDASETQMRDIYTKLGCPEHLGDYAITDPDMGVDETGAKKGLAPSFLSQLLGVAHEAGLNSKQAQKLVDFSANMVRQSENYQAGQAAVEKQDAERQMYETFGADTASMIQKATMALSRLGEGRYGGGKYAQQAAEEWKHSALGNSVNMIAMLANLWESMGEGRYIESSTGQGMLSRDGITADIAALAAVMNDEKRPMDERKAAQTKQLQLYRELSAMNDAANRRGGGGASPVAPLGAGAWR